MYTDISYFEIKLNFVICYDLRNPKFDTRDRLDDGWKRDDIQIKFKPLFCDDGTIRHDITNNNFMDD